MTARDFRLPRSRIFLLGILFLGAGVPGLAAPFILQKSRVARLEALSFHPMERVEGREQWSWDSRDGYVRLAIYATKDTLDRFTLDYYVNPTPYGHSLSQTILSNHPAYQDTLAKMIRARSRSFLTSMRAREAIIALLGGTGQALWDSLARRLEDGAADSLAKKLFECKVRNEGGYLILRERLFGSMGLHLSLHESEMSMWFGRTWESRPKPEFPSDLPTRKLASYSDPLPCPEPTPIDPEHSPRIYRGR